MKDLIKLLILLIPLIREIVRATKKILEGWENIKNDKEFEDCIKAIRSGDSDSIFNYLFGDMPRTTNKDSSSGQGKDDTKALGKR